MKKKKKKCLYSLKNVRQFLNLREHTQRGADQLELQCKSITIKTRHTTLCQHAALHLHLAFINEAILLERNNMEKVPPFFLSLRQK